MTLCLDRSACHSPTALRSGALSCSCMCQCRAACLRETCIEWVGVSAEMGKGKEHRARRNGMGLVLRARDFRFGRTSDKITIVGVSIIVCVLLMPVLCAQRRYGLAHRDLVWSPSARRRARRRTGLGDRRPDGGRSRIHHRRRRRSRCAADSCVQASQIHFSATRCASSSTTSKSCSKRSTFFNGTATTTFARSQLCDGITCRSVTIT